MNSHTSPDAAGYREVLRISLPLILSTSSASLMHVIDRIFLSWHSPEALAASLPAGVTAWAFMSFFIGTAGYVSTFVSQYDGSDQRGEIGSVVWQGIYFSTIGTFLLALLFFAAEPIFELAGHPPSVREGEIVYFKVMALGGGGMIFGAAVSSFYSGRGKTRVVMWINFFGAALNAVLDYLWIFGKAGFPEGGLLGGALATVVSGWIMVVTYFALIFLPENQKRFGTLSSWRVRPGLFRRLIHFGAPSGLHFAMDVMAFTVFVLLIGRIGKIELAASNVAFAINQLIFMPMVGLSLGTSVLVGRYLGASRPEISARATKHSFVLAAGYMGLFSLAILAAPDYFLIVFHPGDESGIDFEAVSEVGRRLLYFVAAYSLLDAANIVYSAALKGAGDTRFVLWIAMTVSVLFMLIPVFVGCVLFDRGIYFAWAFLSLWVTALAAAFWVRFKGGKWREMRVIEQTPAPGAAVTEGPVVET